MPKGRSKKKKDPRVGSVESLLKLLVEMLLALQVYLGSEGALDIEGKELPRLVYISREKRPGYDHHKKAGAMNSLVGSLFFKRWISGCNFDIFQFSSLKLYL